MNLGGILSQPCDEIVCSTKFNMPDYAVVASYAYLRAHYLRGGYADCVAPTAKIAHYLQKLAQIDADAINPIIGADAEYWPIFAEILENLCLIHGLSQLSAWLSLFVDYMYNRSDEFQRYYALMNISQLKPTMGSALIALLRMGDADSPYVMVNIRRPTCNAIKEAWYMPRPAYWRERWLISGARHLAASESELSNVIKEALKAASCNKPVRSLSEFVP